MNSLRKGLVFFALFVLFTLPVAFGLFSELDRNSISFLQNSLPRFLDTPLSFFSLLGSFELTTLILAAIVYKKFGPKRAFMVLSIFGFGMVLELIGKSFITHPSPENIYFRYSLPVYFPSGSVQTGYSYPSGHSYRSAFLAVFVSYLISRSQKLSQTAKRYLYFSIYAGLVVMLFSRVSLGEHWASDVIGGTLLGISFAYLSQTTLSID